MTSQTTPERTNVPGISTLFMADDPVRAVKTILDEFPNSGVIEIALVDQVPMDKISALNSIGNNQDIEYTVHVPFLYNDLAFPHPRVRKVYLDLLKKTIDFAAELGGSYVTTHPGKMAVGLPDEETFSSFDFSRQRYLETSTRSLDQAARYASEADIRLGVENMPGGLLTTPDELSTILSDIPNLGFTLDVGHANITGNLPRYLDLQYSHLHLSNNQGTQDTHDELSRGTIDVAELLEGVEPSTCRGGMILELYTLQDLRNSVSYLNEVCN